jgi:Transposase DDE domain
VSSYPPPAPAPSFAAVLNTCAQSPDVPFRGVLTEEQIEAVAAEEGVAFGDGPGCVFSAAVTLWAFLTQVLSKDKSCAAAVARVIVLLVALGREPCSANTGAYCKARAKLPERFLHRLAADLGERLEDQAPAGWRWHGRRVLLADGTTVLLPDTPANQAAYPQMRSQKPGAGFPIARLVLLLGLATAAALDAALGPYTGKQTSELALLRTLFERLRPGDVLVADRYYCTYWMVVMAAARGVDVVFRLHQQRHYDFRRGRRLGKHDHVVSWRKPQRPDWMDPETYAGLPDQVAVRELRVSVGRRGCRVRSLVLATTLLDGAAYPKGEVGDLYHDRWHAELDLRAIKTYLGMEMLRGQTPAMARKEVWMHLLAYNLIRTVQAQAGQKAGVSPRSLSFTGARQALHAFRWVLLLAEDRRGLLLGCLLEVVAQHRVGERPDRVEPRKVKRRWKTYGLLRRPRAQERAALLK